MRLSAPCLIAAAGRRQQQSRTFSRFSESEPSPKGAAMPLGALQQQG